MTRLLSSLGIFVESAGVLLFLQDDDGQTDLIGETGPEKYDLIGGARLFVSSSCLRLAGYEAT